MVEKSQTENSSRNVFRQVATRASTLVGSSVAFLVALLAIIFWAATGPIFQFSNTWQLAINTGTTIVTVLIVFLIQNTQNRETKAVHLKLDELIRAVRGARARLIDLEEFSDEELERLQEEFRRLQQRASGKLKIKRQKPAESRE